MKKQLKTLVQKGKTAEAIKQLLELTVNNNELHNEVSHLSGRYEKYKKAGLQEHITFEEEGVSFAKIDLALLILVDALEDSEAQAAPSNKIVNKGGNHLEFGQQKAGKDIKVKAKQGGKGNSSFSANDFEAGGSINIEIEQD